MVQVVIEAFVLGVLVSIPVGPVTIGLIRRSLQLGFWNATSFGSGSVSADLLYISLVYLGVAPLLAERLWLRVVLWLLGAGWLTWLGIDAIRSALAAPETDGAADGDSNWRSYVSGVGITLLNPLTIISWLTLGGGYFALHPETGTWWGGLLALVAIVIGLMTHVVVVSAILSTGRRWLGPRVIQVLSIGAGAILVLIGFSFLVSAVQSVL